MNINPQPQDPGGILPGGFLSFIRFAAFLGFIAALIFTTAIVYKLIEKAVGNEEAKKYRVLFVVLDLIIFAIFASTYMVIF